MPPVPPCLRIQPPPLMGSPGAPWPGCHKGSRAQWVLRVTGWPWALCLSFLICMRERGYFTAKGLRARLEAGRERTAPKPRHGGSWGGPGGRGIGGRVAPQLPAAGALRVGTRGAAASALGTAPTGGAGGTGGGVSRRVALARRGGTGARRGQLGEQPPRQEPPQLHVLSLLCGGGPVTQFPLGGESELLGAEQP